MGRARAHAEFATRIALNWGFVTVDQGQQCMHGRCRLFLGEEVEGSDRGLGNQQGRFVAVLCNQDVTRNRQPEIEGRSRRCRAQPRINDRIASGAVGESRASRVAAYAAPMRPSTVLAPGNDVNSSLVRGATPRARHHSK